MSAHSSELPDRGASTEARGRVGAVTRIVAWIADAVLINLVAIITGLGVVVITSMFPIPRGAQTAWEVVAAGVYVLWYAAYFVGFWSVTGQTPGARLMQIRLVVPDGRGVRPARGLVRWVGMQLAAIPLFAGYLPVLVGRRPFPDWLARTLVLDAPEMSVAMAQLTAIRSQREALHQRPQATS